MSSVGPGARLNQVPGGDGASPVVDRPVDAGGGAGQLDPADRLARGQEEGGVSVAVADEVHEGGVFRQALGELLGAAAVRLPQPLDPGEQRGQLGLEPLLGLAQLAHLGVASRPVLDRPPQQRVEPSADLLQLGNLLPDPRVAGAPSHCLADPLGAGHSRLGIPDGRVGPNVGPGNGTCGGEEDR